MSCWVFLIFRQRNDCCPIVSVGFCKACLFFFNVLRLQLDYFFHIPTIYVLKTWSHQCFVLNLVITGFLAIHFPPFFASLQYYTVPFLHISLSFFLCISELLTSFCFSWNKRQAEKKGGVVVALKGISMCVDCFYRVDYSLVQILGVRIREEALIPFSGMNAIVMWV